MTTSAQIRSAWNTAIWTHATVTALTTQIFAFDAVQQPVAQVEINNFYYQQKINFFTYLTMRTTKQQDIAGTALATKTIHTVQVFYYLEKDLTNSAYNYTNCIDRLETVDGLVRSQLGKTWTSTVNYWEMLDALSPVVVELDGKKVWRASYTYTAYNHA